MSAANGWGLACGVVAALPFFVRARRVEARERSRAIVTPPRARHLPPAVTRMLARIRRQPALVTVGRVGSAPVLVRRRRREQERLTRQLPVAVDLIGVAVAAGYTPYLAVELAVRWSPPAVAGAIARVHRAASLGVAFDVALRELGVDAPTMRPLTETLRTSARLGTPITPALTRLAAELRADVRRRAEAHARTVPVRLLFPLVACVLPAFALLTVVPVLADGLRF